MKRTLIRSTLSACLLLMKRGQENYCGRQLLEVHMWFMLLGDINYKTMAMFCFLVVSCYFAWFLRRLFQASVAHFCGNLCILHCMIYTNKNNSVLTEMNFLSCFPSHSLRRNARQCQPF